MIEKVLVHNPDSPEGGSAENKRERNEGESVLEDRDKVETEKVFNQAQEESLNRVKERFEESPDPEGKMDFHDRYHTEGVIKRTEEILSAIRQADPESVSERDILLGKLAAATHDLVQKYDVVEKTDDSERVMKIRKRFIGDNERESSQEAVSIMDELNKEAGREIFSEKDKEIIREAHEATVPGFDPEVGTVIQPNLKPESGVVARALALADIGSAGMDSDPEEFIKGGDALFREENLDIKEALSDPGSISKEQKEWFKERMVNWSKNQPVFARGRQKLLEKELQGLSQPAQDKVKELFKFFDSSISAMEEKAGKRESMDFEELARDMGYEI